MKYKKKPVVISAIQLTPQNIKEIYEWVHGPINLKYQADINHWDDYCCGVIEYGLNIPTLEAVDDKLAKHVASIWDYIIQGIKGEFYPCKPDIFELTYDKY